MPLPHDGSQLPLSAHALRIDRRQGVARLLLAAVSLAALSACTFDSSRPIHPVAASAPASRDDSLASRSSTVLGAAASDLACEGVEIVMEFSREYANQTLPRYVVQGCRKRAVYAEDCRRYPRCSYLLLSVLELDSLGGGAAAPAR